MFSSSSGAASSTPTETAGGAGTPNIGVPGLLAILAAIALGAVVWFSVFSALVLAGATLYEGVSGLDNLIENFGRLDPRRLGGDITAQRLLFAAGTMIYLSTLASLVTVARIAAGRRAGDLLGWRGPWPPITRTGWILFALAPLYHIAAGAAVRFYYPDFALWLIPSRDLVALALSFLMIVVLAPLVEELLFRGLIFGVLRARFTAGATILVTAFLFAIVHWDETGLYPVAVLAPGFVLSVIRERTGSVKSAILAHGAYNFVGWVLLALAGELLVK
jgi:membrane protease YdiL (CAAX protease family)